MSELELKIEKLIKDQILITESEAQDLATLICELPEIKGGRVGAVVMPNEVLADGSWTKEKPYEPCVFMTRVKDKRLGIYDYNIWRLTKIDCGDDGEYLGWCTENGDEWDEYETMNFDEYFIIEKPA